MSSVVPTPGEAIDGDDRWLSLHKLFLSEGKEKEPDVVVLGDYTVAFLHCLNFGIPEDRIENVLWRIENGELDNLNPKVVVLSVGCNDNSSTPEAVAEGVVICATAITFRLPEAQVVVLKLLPCGQHPNSQRDRRRLINEALSKGLKGRSRIQLVDLDPGLVRPDGSISHHDMFDFRHLSRQGYLATFEPLADLVAQLLSEAAGAGDPTPAITSP
ncbi:platelet-activating factor acetylhydrolase alpha isoform X2 [Haemaphysalis longicornis]